MLCMEGSIADGLGQDLGRKRMNLLPPALLLTIVSIELRGRSLQQLSETLDFRDA